MNWVNWTFGKNWQVLVFFSEVSFEKKQKKKNQQQPQQQSKVERSEPMHL